QGKLDDAVQHYRLSLQSDPTRAETHYNYALALQASRRPDEALAEFQKTLQLYPSDLAAYWAQQQMAALLLQRGQKTEAIELLRNAVTINERSRVDPTGNAARNLLEQLQRSS